MLFLGSSVHVAATGWLYTDPGLRTYVALRRGRYLWAPIGLLAIGALLSVVLSPRAMAWVLLPLLAWQLHHFQKQNLGQAGLVTTSLGLSSLRPQERQAICTTGAAGIAGVCAHPALLQLDVRLPLSGYLAPLATLLLAVGTAIGGRALARRPRSDRPASFCVIYGFALLFPLPIFLFTSPYAAVAGMTMAHGLQYLLLMGLVAAGSRRRSRIGALTSLCAIAVVGGVALNQGSHLHNSTWPLRICFGLFLGFLAAHFVVDGGIWRLRESFVHAFLSERVPYLVSPNTNTTSTSLRLPIDRSPI
jgi:hypothetical protein